MLPYVIFYWAARDKSQVVAWGDISLQNVLSGAIVEIRGDGLHIRM